MSSHYHLLVETLEANLVKGMTWFQTTYTTRFNARHRLRGHLFGGHHKAVLVARTEPNDFSTLLDCCSHHVSTGEFRAIVLEAAVDAKKTLCQLAFHQQRLDHPILSTVPETEYLRGYTFELLAAF